jgi:hypothetical protein
MSADVKVADIDGDGDLDILVANNENNGMYINDGGGSIRALSEGAFVTMMSNSVGLEVADIDGDGDLDVLVANGVENNAIYINNGCPAGSVRLSEGVSWCFDCPAFAVQLSGGDGAPDERLSSHAASRYSVVFAGLVRISISRAAKLPLKSHF